jgi:hypothetical protein
MSANSSGFTKQLIRNFNGELALGWLAIKTARITASSAAKRRTAHIAVSK